jgi:ribose-phosphate pyrophosphokinase
MATPLDVPIAIVDKRRPKANISEIMNIIGDIEGKNCIIMDDMIDTAGTITNAANALVEMGAKEVYACATHGVLSGPAIERIDNCAIKEMILLDTVPLPREKKSEKIKTLSVAPLFAEAMTNIHTNVSVSKIFQVNH